MVKFKKGSNAWRFQGNELKYVKEVLNLGFASGTTGSMNMRLEEAFAKRFGVKYAITSNSGTSTLHQALMACGIKPGDEVILPPLTVVMCGYAVIQAGATPVFADIDPKTFLIDPRDIAKKITKKTKAIMVVHLYGQICDMDPIMKLAKKHNLFVIEDCAQCYLGAYKKRLGGTIGHIGSFSMQSSKHITTGDGGILITNNEPLAERMRKFGGLGFKHVKADRRKIKKNRDLFQDPNYLRHNSFGYNYRLSELGAAVGLAQVEKINLLIKKRQKMAKEYLRAIGNCSWLIPQYVPPHSTHSYYTFVAKFDGQKQKGITWHDFRKKYMEFSGDGIYSAWALVYNEPIMQTISKKGRFFPDIPGQAARHKGFLEKVHCPIAEELQPKLMQFTTNQNTERERAKQAMAMKKTIAFFGR